MINFFSRVNRAINYLNMALIAVLRHISFMLCHFFLSACLHGYCPDRFFWATPFLFFLIFSFLCRALKQAGYLVSFWAHINLPYRIVLQWAKFGPDQSRGVGPETPILENLVFKICSFSGFPPLLHPFSYPPSPPFLYLSTSLFFTSPASLPIPFLFLYLHFPPLSLPVLPLPIRRKFSMYQFRVGV